MMERRVLYTGNFTTDQIKSQDMYNLMKNTKKQFLLYYTLSNTLAACFKINLVLSLNLCIFLSYMNCELDAQCHVFSNLHIIYPSYILEYPLTSI